MNAPFKSALPRRRWSVRFGALAALLLGLTGAGGAHGATVLVSDTTLVLGSESSVFAFTAPAAGTVTLQLTDLAWPQALTSLSYVAATASQVVSSWSAAASQAAPGAPALYFQVAAGRTYSASVMATAGGPLGVGAYSLSVQFAPAASQVPLPATGTLLAITLALALGWLGALRRWSPIALRRQRGAAVPQAP